MAKKHISRDYICDVPNTPEGLAKIAEMKAEAKRIGTQLRVRGRGPKKAICTLTGTVYHASYGFGNDIGLGSKGAPYVTYWGVYYKRVRKHSLLNSHY